MTIDIDLSEVVDVARILDDAPKQAAKVVHVAGVAALRGMKAGAKSAAPKGETGFVSSEQGIRTRAWAGVGGGHYDLYTGTDPDGENPGFHVEYGTSRTPPRPFITPQLGPGAEAFAAGIVAAVDPLAGS